MLNCFMVVRNYTDLEGVKNTKSNSYYVAYHSKLQITPLPAINYSIYKLRPQNSSTLSSYAKIKFIQFTAFHFSVSQIYNALFQTEIIASKE